VADREAEALRTFGRTAAQAARAAILFALVGIGIVAALEWRLVRPGTPLGRVLEAAGLPPWAPLLAGAALVACVAAVGFWKACRQRERFTLTAEGLEVRGSLGRYVLRWENIALLDVTPAGALGIRLRDRAALLATHEGTERQRHWLATQEPFGEWDFLYHRAELGAPAGAVVAAARPHLRGEPPA
jgi:hypothetical protein